MSPKAPLRIGQVCDLLRSEFPDVSISKLRFLEEQGLVTPERTPGGYRMYTDHNVRELRHILRMQRDEFLPLKVIRDELQRRLGQGAQAATTAKVGGVSLTRPEEYLAADELCRRAGVSPQFLEECRTNDLVTGLRAPGGDLRYAAGECEIVRAAARMSNIGVDVRNLRQVRSAMGRQAALVEQFAAPRLRAHNADQRVAAVRSVETLAQELITFMREAFVRDVRVMTARAVAGAAERGRAGDQQPATGGVTRA